jgi:hypothetical protein
VNAARWPNLFVVGVARAGTSSLWDYLRQHPDVYMSSLKEPYFFSRIQMRHRPFPKDEDAYLALFAPGRTAHWRGEASTAYFWDEGSPHKIKSVSPDARIVISLRDPVARAYSGYWHAVQFAGERRSFLEAVRAELDSADKGGNGQRAAYRGAPSYVAAGRYAAALERYAKMFGHHLHVLFFEEFVADPRGEMRKLFHFLEVDPEFAERLVLTRRNASVAPRNNVLSVVRARRTVRAVGSLAPAWLRPHLKSLAWRSGVPEMEPAAREFLETSDEEERPRLEALLGRSLTW